MNSRAKSFQPTNVNYGLFPPLQAAESGEAPAGSGAKRRKKLPKRERNERLARRALASLSGYVERVSEREAREQVGVVEPAEAT